MHEKLRIVTERLIIEATDEIEIENKIIYYFFDDVNVLATGYYGAGKHNMKQIIDDLKEYISVKGKFLLSIKQKVDGLIIGFIKGQLTNDIIWINTIIIENIERNKGYGSEAVNNLLDCFKEIYCVKYAMVSVAEQNEKSLMFWRKLGFVNAKVIKNKSINNIFIGDINILKKVLQQVKKHI